MDSKQVRNMDSAQMSKRNISTDFIIRVVPNANTPLAGRVEHVQSGQAQSFADYLELMILIQKKLDQLGVPQPEIELRNW